MAGYIGSIPVPQATQTRETFTATANQTNFATGGYTPNFIDVFMNGAKLAPADFTATNGSDVVLASGAAANDIIDIVAYTAFEVLNQNFTGTTTVAALTATGAISGTSADFDGGVTIDNITIDGAEIDLSSGDLLLDVAGDIILDAAGNEIKLKDSGTQIGFISMASENITIKSEISNKDIIFKGNDGGSEITALTLDMSNAGKATLNDGVVATTGTFSGALAGTLSTAAQTNVTSLGTLTALTVDDVAINGKVVTMTGSSSDTAVFTAGTNGTLSIVTTDAAAAAANIQITADGTAELAGTTVTLNSGGGVTLDADNGTITFADAGSSLGTITS